MGAYILTLSASRSAESPELKNTIMNSYLIGLSYKAKKMNVALSDKCILELVSVPFKRENTLHAA